MKDQTARITLVLILSGLAVSARALADSPPMLVVFNDNGAWCWYQDPRVVHDPEKHTLLIASVAASEGTDGALRGGDVDIVDYDLKSGANKRSVLHHALREQDDHNTRRFADPAGRQIPGHVLAAQPGQLHLLASLAKTS